MSEETEVIESQGTDDETGDKGGPSQDVLDEAFAQGWVPKEQWTGREDEWTDAETFVRRGREINPILRKTLKRKDAELDALRRELAEMKGTVAELAEHRTKIEKLAYERALKDLKAQRKAAMTEGDFERAAEVDEALDQLREAKPDDKPPTKKDDKKDAPAVDPRIASWIERNPWYNDRPENADLVAYANGVSNQMVQAAIASGSTPDPDVILPQVAARVKKVFPDHFKGTTPAMFDTGGEGGDPPTGKPSGKGKGFSSLPADAKAQFDRFYKSGYYPNMKKEDAQAQYFSDYQ